MQISDVSSVPSNPFLNIVEYISGDIFVWCKVPVFRKVKDDLVLDTKSSIILRNKDEAISIKESFQGFLKTPCKVLIGGIPHSDFVVEVSGEDKELIKKAIKAIEWYFKV